MVQFNEIMGNKKLMRLLEFFIVNPSLEVSQIEAINKTKIAKATAVKWMNYLVKEGFLCLKKIGVTNLYCLDNSNLIVKQLKITFSLIQLKVLDPLKTKNIEIYLYGSCARGENIGDSDIDLLILGKIKRNNIVDDIERFSKKIGKDINFKIFSDIEWAMMLKKDKAYYNRVEKDKIRLI